MENEKERKLNKIANILIIIALVFFLFGSGYRFGEYKARKNIQTARTSNNPISTVNTDLSLFWKVWDLLREKYVYQSKISNTKMIYGAIKGMVASVGDPYTFFLTPSENQNSKDDLGGLYEGIGAQLGLKNAAIIIVSPLENSPAKKAGVKPGDYILKVNGKNTKNWTLPQAVKNIRGPKGSIVKLTLARNGEKFVIPIKRNRIIVKPIELSYKPDKNCTAECGSVAYIKITQFGDQTNSLWDEAVQEIAPKWENKKIKALVLDLRGNPGGYLESSVYLASEFIDQGKIIVRQEYADKSGKDYYVEKKGRLLNIPLVVLVNEGSASASEILAGALRDYKRATIVGKKTFGKGSVQEAIDLDNGTGLHMTVAKWILPGGSWINGKGIVPDIKVDIPEDENNTITEETDTQFQKALKIAINKSLEN